MVKWASFTRNFVNPIARMHAALEFKHAISELDEEVSELAEQTQHLEHFTVDSLSVEVGLCALALACVASALSFLVLGLSMAESPSICSVFDQELLGHCSQLYQSNLAGMQQLQAHLSQYGYQSPGPLRQPQDPLSLMPAFGATYGAVLLFMSSAFEP